MKNLKNILLILFTTIILILIFFLVKKINNNSYNINNKKITSEIKFMDNKISLMLNSICNIKLDRFQISTAKINNTTDNKSENTNQNQSNKNENNNLEQYSLITTEILNKNDNIDWDYIKNEVEILYAINPTITLDLYNLNVNKEEILNFNKELDDLTVSIKEEDKEHVLIKLANIYRYLPVFANKLSNDNDYAIILDTKSNIFNSFVFVNLENWEEALKFSKKAIDSYSSIINKIEKKDNNIYEQNKIYIGLNELYNAIYLKNRDAFLIKYKTVLKEFNNYINF